MARTNTQMPLLKASQNIINVEDVAISLVLSSQSESTNVSKLDTP